MSVVDKQNNGESTVPLPHLFGKRTERLTVGLLVASAGSGSTELLGLAATGVSDQQGPVVLDQDVLDLFLGGLVHIWWEKGPEPRSVYSCIQLTGLGKQCEPLSRTFDTNRTSTGFKVPLKQHDCLPAQYNKQ